MKNKIIKKIFLLLFIILSSVLTIIISYIVYLQLNFCRIKDDFKLNIINNSESSLKTDENYRIMTYNIGYGAYSREFSFFLDSAYIKDSKEYIQGRYGKGISKKDVENNINNIVDIMKSNTADIYLLQEVDEKAYRSYDINQVSIIKNTFPKYSSIFAENFHTVFLAYPLYDMHGYANSGILTLSSFKIDSSYRKSYPISNNFIDKFFDLDRCFSVSKITLENNKELIIINNHMSAYDKGGVIRKQQLEVLNNFIKKEYDRGNYIVVGGDFNHDYCDSKLLYMGNKQVSEWIYSLSDNDLPEGFSFVIPENRKLTGSCRGAEEPYNEENTYQSIVDGFIISDNIKAKSYIIDTKYLASDHQPVMLDLYLK